MDIITHLPKSDVLNAEALYDKGDKKRLTLAISHNVTALLAGRERFGISDVEYNLDFGTSLAIPMAASTAGTTFIGIQSTDFIHHQLQELRPRTAYSVEHVTNGKFDFRAVLYVLGSAMMAGSALLPVTFPARHAGYKTLSTGWMVPDVGDVTLGPNLAQNSNQFVTLLALLGQAGVDNATFLSDYIPGTTGELLAGRGLAKFCFRVALNVLNSAQECLCFGAHYKAFIGGMLSVCTINAHSDEGGWIRKLLTRVDYPPSTGIVAGLGREFISFPLQESIPKEEAMRVGVGLLLSAVALIHPADFLANGKTSVYARTEPPTNRISDYGTLTSDISGVMVKWSDLLCDLYGMHHDASSDIGAHYSFLRDPPADRHMTGDFVVPFFFIEPSPLITIKIEGYFKPASLTSIVKLPLFKALNVHHNSVVLDAKGRVSPGSSVWVERSGTTFREEGASYLLSTRYSPDDGLAQFVLSNDINGRPNEAFGFVDSGTVNFADMRWITPHNPMPNPVEGMTLDTTTLRFYTRSLKYDPTPDDLLNAVVESRLSAFKVKRESSGGAGVTHKTVPLQIKRFLKTTHEDFAAVKTLGVVSLRPVVAMAFPPATDDVVEATSGPAVATQTKPPDLSEPPTTPATARPSDSGVRPIMPSVRTANLKSNDGESGNGS